VRWSWASFGFSCSYEATSVARSCSVSAFSLSHPSAIAPQAKPDATRIALERDPGFMMPPLRVCTARECAAFYHKARRALSCYGTTVMGATQSVAGSA
jgi:hypothetical protein